MVRMGWLAPVLSLGLVACSSGTTPRANPTAPAVPTPSPPVVAAAAPPVPTPTTVELELGEEDVYEGWEQVASSTPTAPVVAPPGSNDDRCSRSGSCGGVSPAGSLGPPSGKSWIVKGEKIDVRPDPL